MLEGGSLFDHLHKKGTKFSDDEIVEIALDMSLGMKYLHGKALLHCDLKSPNILVNLVVGIKVVCLYLGIGDCYDNMRILETIIILNFKQ